MFDLQMLNVLFKRVPFEICVSYCQPRLLYTFIFPECLPGGLKHMVSKMAFNNYSMSATD